MPIDNQIDPPQSFMAMYIKPGQTRPNTPQDVVLARYEQCEDMACVLTEHAQTLAFKENFTDGQHEDSTQGPPCRYRRTRVQAGIRSGIEEASI